MKTLSCVVLTKNEEKNIRSCIEYLRFCSEVIVVDDYSTDKTVSIAKRLKTKIYKRHLDSNFSAQRNFALSKCKSDWVLFVDADEIASEKLAEEIKRAVEAEKYTGFYIKRNDVWQKRELLHGEFGNVKLLRLAKRGSGKWKRRVHEVWDIKGRVGDLDNFLIHNPHKSVSDFVKQIAVYNKIHAEENKSEGKSPAFYKIIVFPLLKFINNFILKRGFLDGTHGFVAASLMSFHSYLSWSQLWINQKQQK